MSASGGGFGSGEIVVHGGGGQGGSQVNDLRPRDLWVRLTTNPATNRYGWQQILETDPTFPDYEATGFAFSSSGAVGDLPAYEVNGVGGLPVGEDGLRVRLSLSPAQTFYLFESSAATGGTASSDPFGCSWLAGLTTSDCLALTVPHAAGRCSGIDTDQTLTLAWDGGASKWVSGDDAADTPEDDFVHDIGIGAVKFWIADGRPRMTINSASSPVEGVFDGCASGGAVFAFGGTSLCDGDGEQCGDNVFTVRVECSCCPDPDWEGSGWYCTDEDDCVLLESAPCLGEYTITSGPHADEETCIGVCGGDPASACDCIGGTTLHVLVTDVSGCSGVAGLDVTLTRTGSPGAYIYVFSSSSGGTGGCATVTACEFACATREFTIVFGADNGNLTPVVLALDSCSPFQASGDVTLDVPDTETCCGGTIHVVVTE